MNRAQTLDAPVSLLPLPRPLMTGEVLDAAFRLFRASLLRCLPYSGFAVLVLELPSLYSTFASPSGTARRIVVPHLTLISYGVMLLLITAVIGALTLRLHSVAQGVRPRFRTELLTVVRRWPSALIATVGALIFPLGLSALGPAFGNILPAEALFFVAIPTLWPTAMLVLALPAFWCDKVNPFLAIGRALRLAFRQSWRTVGAMLATFCMVGVFYLLAGVVIAALTPMFGRADLVLVAVISSLLSLIVGAIGVPFVLAVLVVAYADLKTRAEWRRGVVK